MEKVGTINFGNGWLNVYFSLDEPLFRVKEIADLLNYSEGNASNLLNLCEEDEKLKLPMIVAGQRRSVSLVTETGLYNILSQSRMPLARRWRRIVHNELINLRKSRGNDVVEQFDEWNEILDSVYFDEDTNIMMQSVTVAGGDVIQVPFEENGRK